MDPELFPEIPEDLSGLSDDELEELRGQLAATAQAIAAGTADVGELSAQDVLERMTAARADFARVTEEIAGREAGREEFATQAQALAAEMAVSDEAAEGAEAEGEGDGDAEVPSAEASAEGAEELAAEGDEGSDEGDGAEAEEGAEAEAAEAVAASARPAPRLPARARRFRPVAGGEERGAVLVASADVREAGVRTGDLFDDRVRLGMALAETHHRTRQVGTEVVVASADIPYPEERRLRSGDPEGNWQKIQALTDPENHVSDELLASGGICPPYTPIYDFPIYGVTARPVRDSLAGFQADRGGINYPTPLGHASVLDAITVVTEAEDALGGTFAAKACLALDCPEYQTAAVEAISACVTLGNFNARAWPEGVARLNDRVAIAHANVAETELLDAIGAGSTTVVDEQKYGAVSTLLQGILKAAAAQRSRHRMAPETTLRVLLPSWVPDLMQADLAHGQFDRFHPRAAMTRILAAANVAVTFYLDTETGEGQIFGAQSGSGANLLEFPLEAVWYLFPEGAWLFLDMGRLDLGIVRDSVQNETNDFSIFWETFEGAALIGIESLKVTSTICPDGTVAAPETAFACGT